MSYVSVLQWFHLVFSCFQIDDIFGSTAVNGKENGSAAPAPQPNRVWKQCHNSIIQIFTFLHLACSPICSWSRFLCTSSDVSDSRGETAFGKGAGAGSQTEEPAAISTTDHQTSLHHQHQGNTRTCLCKQTHAQTLMACDNKSYPILCCRLKIWQAACSTTWHP